MIENTSNREANLNQAFQWIEGDKERTMFDVLHQIRIAETAPIQIQPTSKHIDFESTARISKDSQAQSIK